MIEEKAVLHGVTVWIVFHAGDEADPCFREVAPIQTEENGLWYFAYGSNPSMDQMMARVGEWKTSAKARPSCWECLQVRH